MKQAGFHLMILTMGDSDFSNRPSMLRFNPCSGNSLIRSRCFLTGLLPFVLNCQVTEFLEISELGLYQACSTAIWPLTTSISRLGISTAWVSPGRTAENFQEQFNALMENSAPLFTERLVTLLFLWRRNQGFKGKEARHKREDSDLQLTGWPITRTRQLNLDQLIPTVRVHLCLQLESWSKMPHKHE